MYKHTLVALTFFLVTPVVALAAYNDVSLTTDTVLTVNSQNLAISGSVAAVESITVNANTFSVDLKGGSSLHIQSTGRASMSYSSSQTVSAGFVCEAPYSQLDLSYDDSVTATTTVTVTVSGSCTVSGSGSNGGSVSSSGGGGGGGGGGSYTPPVTTPAPTPTPAPASTSPASGLSGTQIDAIISLLQSFGADQSVINNVRASLTGTGAISLGSSSNHYTFTRRLKTGSKGDDVKNLQKVLNSDPDTKIVDSGSGSLGNETTSYGSLTRIAVGKFQEKYGLAKKGDDGYGEVGPKTRAKLGEI